MAERQGGASSTRVATLRRYFVDSFRRVGPSSPHATALTSACALVLLNLVLIIET